MTTVNQKILIELELFALERYRNLIEKSMPRLISDEREELLSLAKLFSKDDQESEAKTKLASVQGDFLELYAIPKYIRNSFVVLLWSYFEDTTIALADWYKDRFEEEDPQHLISIKDLKGDFLTRLELFFDQSYVSDMVETSDLEKLKILYRINTFAIYGLAEG